MVVLVKIITTVGKAQAALACSGDLLRTVPQVRLGAEVEDSTYILELQAGDLRLQASGIANRRNAFKLRIKRLGCRDFDSRLVHAACVKVADFLPVRSGLLGVVLRRFFQYPVELFFIVLGELVETGPAR